MTRERSFPAQRPPGAAAIFLAAALAGSNATAAAQFSRGGPGAAPVPARVSVDFEGETVGEFLDALEAANPEPKYSLMIGPGVRETPLDMRVVLNEVPITDAMLFLDGEDGIEVVARNANHFMLQKRERPAPPTQLAVFPADQILAGRDIEDIVALLEQAFVVAGGGEVPRFVLHDETRILMASLTEAQHAVVARVFQVLAEQPVDESEERAKKRQIVREEQEMLKQEFLQLTRNAAEIEKALQDESLPQEVRSEMKMDLRLLEGNKSLIESQIRSYQQLSMQMRAEELGIFERPPTPGFSMGGASGAAFRRSGAGGYPGYGGGAPADPFNPFGGSGGDPFAPSPPTDDDPFASPPDAGGGFDGGSGSPGGNPFGGAAGTDPFGGGDAGTDDGDPFAGGGGNL